MEYNGNCPLSIHCRNFVSLILSTVSGCDERNIISNKTQLWLKIFLFFIVTYTYIFAIPASFLKNWTPDSYDVHLPIRLASKLYSLLVFAACTLCVWPVYLRWYNAILFMI